MNRRDSILAAMGIALVVASAWAIRKTELPGRDVVIQAGVCRIPATIVEPRGGGISGAAIVVHGLSANRHVMRILAETLAAEDNLRAYVIDLPGHGDNTDPFSFPRAAECATAVVKKLTRDGTIMPARTAIVGHSMGGAIAIRMADEEPVAATVAISPAPTVLPQRMPANLLVFSAQYDYSPLRQEAQILSLSAGGNRTGTEDFLQRRAFRLEDVRGANHTSVLINANVAEEAATWIAAAFDPALARGASGRREASWWAIWSARAAPFAGLLGMLSMFPLVAGLVADAFYREKRKGRASVPENGDHAEIAEPSSASTTTAAGFGTMFSRIILVQGGMFALISVLLLKIGVPLKFLHMYSGDYLASLLLIFALLLLGANWRAARWAWNWDVRATAVAIVLGFAIMFAVGAWVNWRLSDLWLNGARWMRFAALLPFCFLFSYAEEIALGPVEHGNRRVLRFCVFLLLRLELWLAGVLAFYALASGNVLIGVLAPALAGFSVLQRLGTDAIRARTGSPTGAAIFSAILASWFIAAIFPLT